MLINRLSSGAAGADLPARRSVSSRHSGGDSAVSACSEAPARCPVVECQNRWFVGTSQVRRVFGKKYILQRGGRLFALSKRASISSFGEVGRREFRDRRWPLSSPPPYLRPDACRARSATHQVAPQCVPCFEEWNHVHRAMAETPENTTRSEMPPEPETASLSGTSRAASTARPSASFGGGRYRVYRFGCPCDRRCPGQRFGQRGHVRTWLARAGFRSGSRHGCCAADDLGRRR